MKEGGEEEEEEEEGWRTAGERRVKDEGEAMSLSAEGEGALSGEGRP
jgi:hypothetical protein